MTSVQSSSAPVSQKLSGPSSAARDEVVRAVMPEIRVLMDHLVTRAVEHSIAPLLAKQNELEAELKALRNLHSRTEKAANPSAKDVPPARAVQTEVRAQAAPAIPGVTRDPDAVIQTTAQVRPRMGTLAASSVMVDDGNASLDIPTELNGSRRRKMVVVMFAIGLLVLLSSVAGLSVLSNMGTYL